MNTTHPFTEKAVDHVEEALGILLKLGAPSGTAESLATAQVHAVLALVDSNRQLAYMNQGQAAELQTANMISLIGHLPENDPRREALLEIALHATLGCQHDHDEEDHGPGYTGGSILLEVHLKNQGITVEPGDDLILKKDEMRQQIVVENAAEDKWVLLAREGMAQITSAQLSLSFGCDLAEVEIVHVQSPDSPRH